MPPKRRATGGDPQQRDKALRAKAMAKHAAENHVYLDYTYYINILEDAYYGC